MTSITVLGLRGGNNCLDDLVVGTRTTVTGTDGCLIAVSLIRVVTVQRMNE